LKVNKKKEAVTAVTQTKIMLLIVLLFICLLICWSVPCQLHHVAYKRQNHFQSYLGTLIYANHNTGGHLAYPSTDGTYSRSVVSLRSMGIAIVAIVIINLDIMVSDVSSTYLEAYT
jgi:glucan phosphoethanolaminetransferase (alkaline phosphatase superfamily)